MIVILEFVQLTIGNKKALEGEGFADH